MSPRRVAKLLAWAAAAGLIVVVALTWWLLSHRSAADAVADVQGILPGVQLHARNFHWTEMKHGKREWVLQARDAVYAADHKSLTLADARLSTDSKDGKPVLVTAPHAVLRLENNHVIRADLSGGTVIAYGDFELLTDQATFHPPTNEIEAGGEVTLVGRGMTVTGTGLSGNAKTQEFQLHGGVKTHFMPRPQDADSERG